MPALLDAMAGLWARSQGFGVCLYLDGCADGSAAVAASAATRMPFALVVTQGGDGRVANAGAARRAAMAAGLERLGAADGLLFTTDADSRPDAGWIAAGVAALAQADFVAGRIVRANGGVDGAQSRIERYYDRLYACRRAIDPVPWEACETHHFSGGANMAMRASAYRAIGGFRPLPFAEDATLLDDAARAGFRVRRDAAMIVETSSRRNGRAVQGLASALKALDDGQMPRVAHPAAMAWQWQAQAAARRAFATIGAPDVRMRLGVMLGLTGDHVLGVARDCPNGEAFAMRVVPAAAGPDGGVTLDEAEAALAMLAGPAEAAA